MFGVGELTYTTDFALLDGACGRGEGKGCHGHDGRELHLDGGSVCVCVCVCLFMVVGV